MRTTPTLIVATLLAGCATRPASPQLPAPQPAAVQPVAVQPSAVQPTSAQPMAVQPMAVPTAAPSSAAALPFAPTAAPTPADTARDDRGPAATNGVVQSDTSTYQVTTYNNTANPGGRYDQETVTQRSGTVQH